MVVYRRGGRRRYVLVLLLLTAITLITLDKRSGDSGPLGAVGRAAHEVVSPVAKAVNAVTDPVGDWFEGVTSAGSLKRDNDRLRAELADAESRARRGDAALQENRRYKELLELEIPEDSEAVAANVVLGPAGNYESTIIIDKGSDAGVGEGMPVVAAEGLVGRVIEVWSSGAKVLLLTDSRSGVSVRMVRPRLTGQAHGRAGRSTLVLDLVEPIKGTPPPAATSTTTISTTTTSNPVPLETDSTATTAAEADPAATTTTMTTAVIADEGFDVVVGDDAVTSGLEGSVFPPGFLVGEVVTVESNPGTTLHRVILRPFVDFSRLEIVRVLRWTPSAAAPEGG